MNCLVCSKRAYSDYCVQHKPRAKIATRTALPRPTKPIKRSAIRKVKTRLAMQWEATRQQWFSLNTSPYACHYCGIQLFKKTVTLDHKIPRSRAPQLRYVLSNLVPCCFTCNGLKGSVDHDSYKHVCHT